MATESSSTTSSRSNTTADSYIGSLISLTSKSEIRYEGVLYNINTEESSIGLKNVRSFGTEGRKKDGPQIPPSDKVYEYILFRGTDIKDLQVKSSPPVVQPTAINNDPAIIQSHYPRPVSTSVSVPSTGTGSLNDFGTHNTQMALPGSNFQGGLPLYQPGGNLGPWGASPPPPPNANGSGLAMPMYWQGYYAPPNGLPHLHQQSLLRPPPGLSMPPSMQQPMQYPNFNTNMPAGASNLPGSNLPASNLPASNMPTPLPDISTPLLPTSSSSLSLPSSSSAILPLPSTLPLMPSANLSSETLLGLMPNKAHSSSLPAANLSVSLTSLSPLTTSSPEISPIVPPMANNPNAVSGQSVPYQSTVQSTVGASNAPRPEVPTPSLVTPGQLLQSGPPSVPSSQPVQIIQKDVQTPHKDVEVVQVSASSSLEPSIPVATEAQPPILPLPVPSRTNRPNGAPFHNRYGPHYYRGRGRGTGSSRPVTKFTEDFDFMAMNEKFNKDEVWGHLGKGNKSHKDKYDGKISDDDDDSLDEVDDELAKIEIKPMYNKDDFFDTLSSNANDHDSQNGRTRFSEQMKIDTETFGDFSRYRGRGGRGGLRGGGRYRGSYHGRGYSYGYVGRGRGRSTPNRTS